MIRLCVILMALVCGNYVTAQSETRLGDYTACSPLDIIVSNNGSVQVFKSGVRQLYSQSSDPPSSSINNSVILTLGTTEFGFDQPGNFNYMDHGWGAGTVSGVNGTGTSSDPWVITTTLMSSTSPGTSLTVAYTYVQGSEYFDVSATPVLPAGNTSFVKLYQVIDTYLDMSDNGPAYTLGTTPFSFMGAQSVSGNLYLGFILGNTQWNRYYSGQWSTGMGEPIGGADLSNTLDFNSTTDNAIGVQWDLGVVAGAQSAITYKLSFSTSAPVPEVCNDGIDNDQDGLIDCFDCEDCLGDVLCSDTDSDGIQDACDQDGDNDGLTNSTESYACTNPIPSSSIIATSATWIDMNMSVSAGHDLIVNGLTSSLGPTTVSGGPYSGQSLLLTSYGGTLTDFDGNRYSAAGAYTAGPAPPLAIPVAGLTVANYQHELRHLGMIDVNANGTYDEGVDQLLDPLFHARSPRLHKALVSGDFYAIYPDAGPTNNAGDITFSVQDCGGIDTDDDGIPDHLDQDSDGDGCLDVTEASYTDDNGDGELGSVPLTVDQDGLVTSGSDGYAGTNAFVTNALQQSGCPDSDLDLVSDAWDLDDDNDGILDVDECNGNFALDGAHSTSSFSNTLLETTASGNSYRIELVNGITFNTSVGPGLSNFSGGPPAPYNGSQTHLYTEINTDKDVGVHGELIIDFVSPVENPTLYLGGIAGHVHSPDWSLYLLSKNPGLTMLELYSDADTYINGDTIKAEQTSSNNGNILIEFTGVTDRLVFDLGHYSSSDDDGPVRWVLNVGATYCIDVDGDSVHNLVDLDSDNDGIYDVIEAGHGQVQSNGSVSGAIDAYGIPSAVSNGTGGVNFSYANSDGAGLIDPYSLDSDNDGCFDVLEAGYTDANNDGILGTLPVNVNVSGLVTP